MEKILKFIGLGASIIAAICTAGEKSFKLIEETKKAKEENEEEA